jgi:hypothetical protein
LVSYKSPFCFWLGFASSRFGSVTRDITSLNLPLILHTSTKIGGVNLRVNSPVGKPYADGDDRSKATTISGFEVGFEMMPPAG